ncbi:hypothetical protein KDK88_07475, partial [bacterium]|nr:hypothetical protein [bacterium]
MTGFQLGGLARVLGVVYLGDSPDAPEALSGVPCPAPPPYPPRRRDHERKVDSMYNHNPNERVGIFIDGENIHYSAK